MGKPTRTRIIFLIAIAILALLLIGGYFVWARPGRLNRNQCVKLISHAFDHGKMEPAGPRVLEFMVGNRYVRLPELSPDGEEPGPFREGLKYFKTVNPEDNFFDKFEVRHVGRILAARRVCERIRISPTEYSGDSTELWLRPGDGSILAWRHCDSKGKLKRGYRTIRIDRNFQKDAQSLADLKNSNLRDKLGRISPEEIKQFDNDGTVALPDWVPPGFKLTGGRIAQREGLLERLGGVGPQPPPFGFMGKGPGRHFIIYYSDGLNTITIVLMPHRRIFEILGDPDRFNKILEAKSLEVERLFKTAMVGGILPSGLVLVYGETDRKVLMKVIKSIPQKELRMSPDFPPDFVPGIPPGAEGESGMPGSDRMGPGGGWGQGMRRGQGPQGPGNPNPGVPNDPNSPG
ncbi:MAG: hypothetical protein ABIC40_00310 [bacterium]